MLLIFKATPGFEKHNRDNIVSYLGRPARDGDVIDIDEGQAKVLLDDFPNNWLDYKEEVKRQEAESKQRQKEIQARLRKSNATSGSQSGEGSASGSSTSSGSSGSGSSGSKKTGKGK